MINTTNLSVGAGEDQTFVDVPSLRHTDDLNVVSVFQVPELA